MLFRSKPIDIDRSDFEKKLIRLHHAASMHDNSRIRRLLKELVSTYTYNNDEDLSTNSYDDDVINIEDIKRDFLLKHLDII